MFYDTVKMLLGETWYQQRIEFTPEISALQRETMDYQLHAPEGLGEFHWVTPDVEITE